MNSNKEGGYVEFSEGKFLFKEGKGGWVKKNNVYPNSNKEFYTWIAGEGKWILNDKNMYEWKPNQMKIL